MLGNEIPAGAAGKFTHGEMLMHSAQNSGWHGSGRFGFLRYRLSEVEMTKRSPVPRRGWIWLLVFAIFVVLALVRVAFFFGIETPIEPPATMPIQLPSDVPHSTLQATSSPTLFIPTPLPGEQLSTIRYDQLPTEGQEVIALIARGGPFPYDQDGSTFQNREQLLPIQPSGYYKEYTVETPGSSDRGARRIVAGLQGELYYTMDHYASFMRVIP